VVWLHHTQVHPIIPPVTKLQTDSGTSTTLSQSASTTDPSGQSSSDLLIPPPPKQNNLPPRATISGPIAEGPSPDTFYVDGNEVSLAWVETPDVSNVQGQNLADKAFGIASQNGADATCKPVGTTDYQCMINENDLAELMLQNGLTQVSRATTADGAPPPSYDIDEQNAKANQLGLFAPAN
jgi:endonuclease YncB( thermonuclease family)